MHPHLEQSFPHHKPQQQNLILGWTQESSAAPSQSASSAVVSPATRECADSPSDSLGQSCTSLKEHDYIGLAEVSSASCPLSEPHREAELNYAETDLRLGLGPSSEALSDKECKDRAGQLSSHTPVVALHIQDDAKLPSSMPSIWQSLPSKSLSNAMSICYQNPTQFASAKNGSKRLYREAMVDVLGDSRLTMNAKPTDVLIKSSESKSCATPVLSMKQLPDGEAKYPEGLLWTAPHAAAWQSHSEARSSTYRAMAAQKGLIFSSVAGEGNVEVARGTKPDFNIRNNRSRLQPLDFPENEHDEAPPAKGQVVGWPPVRAYRRSTLSTGPKPPAEEGDSQSNIYVKVNMDGIPIGRKVDLSAYNSYDGLLAALEDMFHNPNGGCGAQFLKGAEFVLTYEDKEGDWMLVGDVPWSMFINTVRRLRITRGPQMAGVGSKNANTAGLKGELW